MALIIIVTAPSGRVQRFPTSDVTLSKAFKGVPGAAGHFDVNVTVSHFLRSLEEATKGISAGDTISIGDMEADRWTLVIDGWCSPQREFKFTGNLLPERSQSSPSFRVSRVLLRVGGQLLPAAARDRWVEEWGNQLRELPTRRKRLKFTSTLIVRGIPQLAISLRKTRASRSAAWPGT